MNSGDSVKQFYGDLKSFRIQQPVVFMFVILMYGVIYMDLQSDPT